MYDKIHYKKKKVVPTRKNDLKEGEEVKDCDDFER